MLRVEALTVGYGPIVAVSGLSIEAGGGEIVALVGANGAGKSSLLNAIGGFQGTESGQILLDGVPLGSTGVGARVRSGIALVQEGRQIWPELTVDEHLRLGAKPAGLRRAAYQQRLERVQALFPRLAERRRQLVGTLSGGEQQMVVIARALVAEPRVLLLDEPTLGLAPTVMDAIADALEAMRSPDLTIVVAEQNTDFALSVADRGYVLEVGTCRLEGAAAELAANPDLIHAYLGETVG